MKRWEKYGRRPGWYFYSVGHATTMPSVSCWRPTTKEEEELLLLKMLKTKKSTEHKFASLEVRLIKLK